MPLQQTCPFGVELLDYYLFFNQIIQCPKFEVYVDKKGEYRFRLKATNGQIIAVSEGYVKMASCMKGIESVKKNAVDAPIEEVEE